jgi:hypothetical protein
MHRRFSRRPSYVSGIAIRQVSGLLETASAAQDQLDVLPLAAEA